MSLPNSPPEILVVDDNIGDLRLLSSLLEGRGYRVRQAIDGEMAWIALQTRLPDLVILDINLPKVGGCELCTRLNSPTETPSPPVLFLSTADEVWCKVKAFEVGAVDYMTKPYIAEEFLARVALHLRHSLQVRQLFQQNRQLQKQVLLTQTTCDGSKNPAIDPCLLLRAIDATLTGITIADASDPNFPIIFANEGFERMTGYSFAEIKGKTCRFLQNNDIHQPAVAEIRACIEAGTECRVMLRNYRKNGELFWNELYFSPVKNERGEAVYYICVYVDVSDRVRSLEGKERDKAAIKKMNRELVELTEKLNQIANADGLTGVATRRHFDYSLQREWRRMMREQKPLSLIMIDVDCFKRYNDTYGHLAGDDCLKVVAKTLQSEAKRPSDLAARFGGEEFAIILPDTSKAGAMLVAQHILQSIRQLEIAHVNSLVSSKIVTLSIGVATHSPQPGDRLENLLDLADSALFLAKEAGRDRACSVQ